MKKISSNNFQHFVICYNCSHPKYFRLFFGCDDFIYHDVEIFLVLLFNKDSYVACQYKHLAFQSGNKRVLQHFTKHVFKSSCFGHVCEYIRLAKCCWQGDKDCIATSFIDTRFISCKMFAMPKLNIYFTSFSSFKQNSLNQAFKSSNLKQQCELTNN